MSRAVAALALFFATVTTAHAQAPAPTLGHALAQRGYTYACWYSGTASGLVPRMTPFHPAVPLTSPVSANFASRYGAGDERRSWARQEQATRMSQIAEPVVNHPSNPLAMVNNATWRLNADYPQSVTDLFALCRGGHGDAALDEFERLFAALYPEAGEPVPTPTPPPPVVATPTPTPPPIHPPPVVEPTPTPLPPPVCPPVAACQSYQPAAMPPAITAKLMTAIARVQAIPAGWATWPKWRRQAAVDATVAAINDAKALMQSWVAGLYVPTEASTVVQP